MIPKHQSLFKLQVKCILKKNFISALKSREIYIENLIPLIVSIMLISKSQLGPISSILPMLVGLTQCATSRSIVISIVEEKSKRFKETQKIMGLSQSAYITAWILTAYIRAMIVLLSFVSVWALLNVISDQDWYFNYRNSFASLTGAIFLYSISAINQSLFISALCSEVKLAGEILAFLSILMTFFLYATFVPQVANSLVYFYFFSIISPSACMSFIYTGAMSTKGSPITHLLPSNTIHQNFPVSTGATFLAIMAFIYFIGFIYADQVMPNEFGVQKHPLFFLNYIKFRKRGEAFQPKDNLLTALLSTNKDKDKLQDISSAKYHENINRNRQPTIRLVGVTKNFGKFKAVDNLTLNLYENEIFCLLGHNGAGKTTTISLLTGLYEKSSGLITMYDLNLDKNLIEVRKMIGLCNQKDILYNYLTVLEHLNFMSGIKGIKQDNFDHILNTTELTKEKDKQVKELSGGSKRKLSLALSLLGNSKIIFLDEPTSGMDSQSRRSIWKILERIKQDNRTIILTTHHLDEAEILADRIGIMAKGQLLAVGTSDFIKRKFGEGYNLKLRMGEQGEQYVNSKVNQGVLQLVNRDNDVAQSNDSPETSPVKSFKKLLYDNQNSPGKLYLIGLLEKYIPEGQFNEQQSTESISYLVPFSSQKNLKDVFDIIEDIPTISVSMELNTLEEAFVNIGREEEKFLLMKEEEAQRVQVNQEQELKEKPSSLDLNSTAISINDQEEQIPEVVLRPPRYISTQQVYAMIKRRYLMSIKTATNIWSLAFVLVFLTLGNLAIKHISFNKIISSDTVEQYIQLTIMGTLCVVTLSFSSTLIISLPVMERELKLKQCLHSMGCGKVEYWLGTYIFDLFFYYLQITLYLLGAFACDLSPLLNNFGPAFSIYVMMGFNFVSYIYAASTFFETTEQALKLFAVFNFFFVYIIPYMIQGILNFIYAKAPNIILEYLIYSFQALFLIGSPLWTFFQGFPLIQNNYQSIEMNSSFTGPLLVQNYKYYVLTLGVQTIVFLCILGWRDRNLNFKPKEPEFKQDPSLDQKVQNERLRVFKEDTDVIQTKMLEKEYNKGEIVLREVSFGVKQEQIFGIVGPTSSGKSTIINSIVGLVEHDSGRILLDQKDAPLKNVEDCLKVGVCPQFDCIWEVLNCSELLELFGRIKGLSGQDLQKAKAYYLRTMQLEPYTNKKSGQLSGGNKRKLCVANALIGGSSITFFDEPSTGVDPIARRFLFTTLKNNVKQRGSSAIITTHTIEEAEVLCDRLALLVQGQFLCLGTPEELRSQYSTGFTITVKLSSQTSKSQFNSDCEQKFINIKILDDKRSHYQTLSMPDENFNFFRTYEYFDRLVRMKIIEDFSINQSSLEQIFLFCQKQQTANESLE